jgi:hypothetical protein
MVKPGIFLACDWIEMYLLAFHLWIICAICGLFSVIPVGMDWGGLNVASWEWHFYKFF